jgi:hypothetical protein
MENFEYHKGQRALRQATELRSTSFLLHAGLGIGA